PVRKSPMPTHPSRLRLQWLQRLSDHPPWFDMASRLLKRVSTRRSGEQVMEGDSVRIVTSHRNLNLSRFLTTLMSGRRKRWKECPKGHTLFHIVENGDGTWTVVCWTEKGHWSQRVRPE